MSKQIKKYDELYSNIELVPDEAIKDTDDPQGFDVDWDLVEEKYQQHRHGHHHHSSGHSHHHSSHSEHLSDSKEKNQKGKQKKTPKKKWSKKRNF